MLMSSPTSARGTFVNGDLTSRLKGRPASQGASRVPLLRPTELDDEQAQLYADITNGPRRSQASVVPLVDEDGSLLGPFGVMLLAPRIGSTVQAVGAALRFDESLPPRSRELAILAVAAHRRSEFEWFAHENAALAVGLTAVQLQALLDGEMPGDLEPAEEAVVHAVRDLLREGELDDGGYAEAVSALGTETLVSLVWLVGYYSMLATALATFRPPLRPAD
jgi:alkylhydroperoxidase family enzyme